MVAGRLARSATSERACDEEGRPGDAVRDIFLALARGGAPWINTGYAYVLPNGQTMSNQNGIHSDDLVPAWRMIADAVRQEAPDCRLFMQLVHGGRQVSAESVKEPIAPSDVPQDDIKPRGMTQREIEDCLQAFADAARRAREAGFDGVQLHCAHGYLLSQFLSPYINRRQDEWGGTPERRRRFVLETLRRTREAVGPDRAVTVKLNCEDFHPDGLTLGESCEAARALAAEGIDAIETSAYMQGGDPRQSPSREGDPSPEQEGYYLSQTVEIKRAVGLVPVGACGGFRTRQIMERVITAEGLDFVAASRPFIAEPDLMRRFRAGQARATCISCNQCGTPLSCPLVADGRLKPPPLLTKDTPET